jgi:putative endopeptidase
MTKLISHLAAAVLGACATLCLPLAAAADTPRPGDDFYGYANDAWVASTLLPAGAGVWSVRAQVRENNLAAMAKLYRDAAANVPGTTAAAKRVGDYFVAQLDGAAIEAKGLAPIRPLLGRIAGIADIKSLSHFLGTTLRIDVDPVNFGAYESDNLFGLWVGPALQNPTRHTPYLLQGGIGLPQSALYQERETVEAYRRYIASVLEQAGVADPQRKSIQVVELETRIAAAHASRKTSADLSKSGQVWRRADLAARAKGMDWNAFFSGAGMPRQDRFGAWQPDAIKGLSALVAAAPLDAWKAYLSFHAVRQNARFLPKALADAYFAFFDPLILGPGQSRPLWEHAMAQTNTAMPGAGQLFVERHFSPKAKAEAQGIVDHIVAAFDRRIGQLAWMTPGTRKQAREKLRNMVISIGTPQQWIDSTGLEIRADDAFGNEQRAALFNYRYQVAKIGKPVERKEWIPNGELFGINPMPLQNALTIPVTELQAPFFDPDGSDADNYGAIGVRIARFLAQAIDENGSQFDAQGRARNWWSQADRSALAKAAAGLVAQYASYAPFADAKLDGKRTLNDNIAEQAGLLAAYDAFQMARAEKHDPENEQLAARRFFMAYARSMRVKSSVQALRGQVLGSPQAPAPYRVAAVRNLDAWYATFDVAPGQGQYLEPSDRVRIW